MNASLLCRTVRWYVLLLWLVGVSACAGDDADADPMEDELEQDADGSTGASGSDTDGSNEGDNGTAENL